MRVNKIWLCWYGLFFILSGYLGDADTPVTMNRLMVMLGILYLSMSAIIVQTKKGE